ncbi:MAG: L,D-transpeptidase family protein [Blautia sp.]|nr:L,D-transpeptidase family protein [Blautia sp.]
MKQKEMKSKEEKNERGMENRESNMEKKENSVPVEKQEADGNETADHGLQETKQMMKKEDSVKDQTDIKENADDRKDLQEAADKAEKKKTEETFQTIAEDAADGAADSTKKKSGKMKKILIPIAIMLVLLMVCGGMYTVTAFSYRDKFLPGTWVNGIDCTELDGAQVAGMLENQLQTYLLEVTGRDWASGDSGTLLGQITAEDISLTYSADSRKAVDDLLAQQDIFTWLYRRLSDDTYSFDISQGVAYDEEKLISLVNGWEACLPGHMTAPQDAYISEYSEKLKGYEVVPEVEGTEFDIQMLLELMNVAIHSQETSLDLEAAGCYAEPTVRQDAAELTEAVETANQWLGAKITYDWNGAEVVVDTELLKEWITMEKDGPVLDEEAVAAFVKEQAAENDTYGKRRNFVTTLGVELSLPSGYYGWQTDREAETAGLIEAIQQGRTLSREPVYANSAMQKGRSDIGNSYVEVDLTHQHLYLYEDGAIILETDFVSGNMSSDPGCVTPEGVFGISYKTTNAVLRGATYETPVNYWMPFYGNYGLHDATWRSEFGGQIYITNGSHGCVNLPLGSAATIYEHVSAGFPVICYYYQVDPLAVQPPVAEEWYDDSGDEE